MIRKVKVLGPAFVAVLAMSATMASAAQAITINSSSYPQTVTGKGTGIGEHFRFHPEVPKAECHESEYHGTLSEPSSTLTVAPDYTFHAIINGETKVNCKAFGFLGATFDTEGCHYVFHGTEHDAASGTYTAHVDIACPVGQSIKISAGTCKVEVKGQNGLTTADITNMAGSPADITVRPTIKGIAYTVTQDGFGCQFLGTGNNTGGEYTSSGYITVTAAGGLSIST